MVLLPVLFVIFSLTKYKTNLEIVSVKLQKILQDSKILTVM